MLSDESFVWCYCCYLNLVRDNTHVDKHSVHQYRKVCSIIDEMFSSINGFLKNDHHITIDEVCENFCNVSHSFSWNFWRASAICKTLYLNTLAAEVYKDGYKKFITHCDKYLNFFIFPNKYYFRMAPHLFFITYTIYCFNDLIIIFY